MWKTLVAALLALALVAGHFWFLHEHCPPTFQSADANGYLAQVELVANHGRTELQPVSPLGYVGLHWLGRVTEEDGVKVERFHSRYPPGVAWLLAPFYRLLGPEPTLYVTPMLGSLTLLFLFLLCLAHVGPWLALVAVLVYAWHPDANSHALNWGAHTQVGFFLLAGLYLIDSWSRRPSWWRVFLGGFCLGAMPTMRPAEATAGLGIALFLCYHLLRQGEIRQHYKKHVAIAVAGAAIPIAALLIHNYRAFGDPLSFGYALTGEQQAGSGFGLEFFLDKWRPFTEMLMSNGGGLFFGLGVLGLFGMLFHARARGTGLLLLGVLAPITLTYMAYYWGSDSSGLRFLIPTFPLYVLPALWLIRQAATDKRVAIGAVSALVALQAVLWVPETLERAVEDRDRLQAMDDSVQFLDRHLPADSILIVERQLAETLQYYPKWELLDASVVAGGRGMGGFGGRRPGGRAGRADGDPDQAEDPNAPPERASPMQRGKGDVFRKQFNAVRGAARDRLVAEHLEALRKQHKGGVYWLANAGVDAGATRRPAGGLGGPGGFGGARGPRAGRAGGPGGGPGGGTNERAAMRRLDFPEDRRFKFVESVTLSTSSVERARRQYAEDYEKAYGEPPPRSRRAGRGGMAMGAMGGRGRRGGGPPGGAGMFGPRFGAQYRLYKLADRGEVVSVEELARSQPAGAEAPPATEAAGRRSEEGKAVDAGAGTKKHPPR